MDLDIAVATNEDEGENETLPVMDDPDLSRRMASYWKAQIEQCDEGNEVWHKRGHTIIMRYRDERNRVTEENQRRLNVLWSNVQILRPALYGRTPQPVIERRFLDKDPVARVSATILERCVRNELEENGFHHAMKTAVNDMLLPGRGQVWVRYEPEIGESISLPVASQADMQDAQGLIEPDDDDEATQKLEETGQEVIAESVPVDYVPWKDFYIFPPYARTWAEVQGVGKRVSVSKEGCIDRFGEKIGAAVQADPSEHTEMKKTETNMAVVHDADEKDRVIYEIWSKSDRTVYWVSKGYHALCDAREDPLQLRNFFPCPEPLSATLTNDSLIPIPDYMEYQDQAIQIDELTQRISMLAKSIKACGTYDAANRALRRLLEEDTENMLIPVDNWAQFSQKGGLEGGIFLMPIDQQIKALGVLVQVREGMLNDIDRITGISDVLRGTTDARETLGGQRLKSNNAGTRLDERRSDVARFARDVIRLIAEIVAKHFTEKTLIEASGVLYEDEFQPKTQQPQQPPMPGGPQQPGPMAQQPLALPPPNSGPPMGMQPGQGIPGPGAGPMPGQPPMGMPQGQPMPGNMGAPSQSGPMPGMVPLPGNMPMQPSMPQPMNPAVAMMMAMAPAIMKIQKSIDLLRRDISRGYRIDIETDSMVQGDIEQERQDAVEFLGAITKFIAEGGQLAATSPDLMPLMGKFLQFGVRKFRTGRDLESAIDEYVDKLQKNAQNAQGAPAKPDPKMQMEQIKLQQAQMELDGEKMKTQAEVQKAQVDAAAQAQNDARDRERQQATHQLALEKLTCEQEFAREEHQMKMQELAQRLMEISAKTGLPPPSSPHVKQHQDNIDRIANAADKIHQAALLHHQAATMPRRVLRGPDGRAVGIAPVLGQIPQPVPGGNFQ